MKNIKNILTLMITMSLLYSCSDAIDIEVPGLQDDSVIYNTVSDLQSGLDGVYGTLDLTQDMYFNSNFSDEITRGASNGGQGLDGFNFFLSSGSDESFVFWRKYYQTIMIASRVIEAAEGITPESGEENQYNEIVGSLKAIRAYSHFMIFAYYTPDYTDDSGLAIPIIDFVPSVEHRPTRNTVSEFQEYFITEVNEAQSLLPQQSKYLASKDFCRALIARFSAFRQDYDTALTVSQSLLGSYPISNPTQFISMFSDGNQDDTEVIFQLARTVGDNYDQQAADGGNGTVYSGGRAGNVYAFTGSGPNGGPFFYMNRALFNLYDEDDIRADVYLHPGSTINPNWDENADASDDQLVINKYPGKDGTPLMADLKIFRSAEMLLIAAESHVANNNLNNAATLIKQLRDSRLSTGTAPLPVYGSQQEGYLDVITERRKELAFEGHRYFDIKRLGARAGQGLDRAINECNAHSWAVCSLDPSDYRFTLPIPTAEFDGNPNMEGQQNPNY